MELTTLVVGVIIRRVRVVVEVAMRVCTHAVMVVIISWLHDKHETELSEQCILASDSKHVNDIECKIISQNQQS